jgi:NADH-quinone oxidoreductase subunit C
MTDTAALSSHLISKFPGAADNPAPAAPFVRGGDEPQIKVPADKIAAAAEFLKNQEGFDLLSFVTAVDYIKENRFELVYYLQRSADAKSRLILKVDLPRTAEPHVASVAPVWSGADWQEREIYDLYGIFFDNHPNLKRILLWEGYQGYPLRKDYVHIQDKYDNGQEIGLPKPAPATPPPPAGAAAPTAAQKTDNPAANAPAKAPENPPAGGAN